MLELIEHPRLTFRGCSVTLPHKENLIRLALEQGWEIDPAARAMGAGNTLVVGERTGEKLRVLNTDASGLRDVLEKELGSLQEKRISILGAGGMARAATYACVHSGALVTIHNRTRGHAERLARDLSHSRAAVIAIGSLADVVSAEPDVVINCTSVGMTAGPAPSDTPLDVAALARRLPDVLVIDTVYKPRETPLLKAARAAGLRTLDGVGLFLAQAARQFEAWTGSPAPRALFERVAAEALAAREDETAGPAGANGPSEGERP